ncbi:hypothetical protein [Hymenobacter nivis]|nr:hypothetical protein [Hymenobacter nivis]
MNTLAPSEPWIRSARYDGALVLAPPFVALLVVLVLPARHRATGESPLLA